MVSVKDQMYTVPREYLFRRLHSLLGFGFFVFLLEHLFTNSQVLFFFLGNHLYFVKSVNLISSIPYLHVVEWLLIGMPIIIHGVLGVHYMISTRNSILGSGVRDSPSFSLHRIAAFVLLFGIIFHVLHMRILNYPVRVFEHGKETFYAVVDRQGYKSADNLGMSILTAKDISENSSLKYSLFPDKDQIVVGGSFGQVELMVVRDRFQNSLTCILYTIFLIAAAFHGSRGFWTFLISWGMILSYSSQSKMKHFSLGLTFVLFVLGSMAIWGSYFVG